MIDLDARSVFIGSFQSKLISRTFGLLSDRLGGAESSARAASGVAALTRYCNGQPTGGPISSGEIRVVRSANSVSSAFCSRALDDFALVEALGDDHRFGEIVVGQLHIERQVEAERTLPDIEALVLDVRDRPSSSFSNRSTTASVA